MFLSDPPRTQFDINFSIAGIPIRIHPLFWLMGLILGVFGAPKENGGVYVVIWVVVIFVSILVHELGHAFTMRAFGERARVVLYLMGGFATTDTSSFGSFGFSGGRSRSSREQIIISAAGPAAGFALAGLVIAIVFATGGRVWFHFDSLFFWDFSLAADPSLTNTLYLYWLVQAMLWVNIFFGLMNLLPVYPLDGGQIAREVMVGKSPMDGLRKSLVLSTVTGAVVAGLGLLLLNSIFIALMFGSLAFSSWQVLQQISGRGGGFGGGFGGGGGYGGGGRPW